MIRRFPLVGLLLATLLPLVPLAQADETTPADAVTPSLPTAPSNRPVAWGLDNGMTVVLMENHANPMVAVRLLLPAGASREPEGQAGLAALTEALLWEGSHDHPGLELMQAFESLGIRANGGVGRDTTTVSVTALSREGGQAMALLAETVGTPNFDPADVDRIKGDLGAARRKSLEDPDTEAAMLFRAQLFAGHPYAHDPDGTVEGIAARSRDEIVAFHNRFYTPQGAVLVVAGDVDRPTLDQWLAPLDGWKGPLVAPIPRLPNWSKPQAQTATRDLSQSTILMGFLTIDRGDPDYPALYVANYILGGGGFTSRILHEIREKRGLAYSAYSYLTGGNAGGAFIAGAQTKNATRDEATALLRREIVRMAADGPSQEEFDAAIRYLTGSFPVQMDTLSKVADRIAVDQFQGLGADGPWRFLEQIRALTLDQVRAVARKHFHPDQIVAITVGGTIAPSTP